MDGLWVPLTATSITTGFAMMATFVAALFAGAKWLPGAIAQGFPQPSGEVKTYKLNGLLLFALTQVALMAAAFGFGWSPAVVLAHFWPLFIAFNALSVGLTLFLFLQGRTARRQRGAPVRSVVRDLWFGPELNPEVLGVDLKMFCYQPSLIGLGVLVQTFAFAQWEVHGTVTPQMLLYVAFWWAYLLTHYLRESFMLSTWDIIAENFGFMLVWGDLTFVPFFYSIGGWFLLDTVEPLSLPSLTVITALYAFGHLMFRGANWQKDRYKRDPTAKIWGKLPETLHGRLLVSGWWGIGRKLNYTGEILVYISIALLTGFAHWAPYSLPLWLTVLLLHRAGRDDQRCRAKYGEKWDDYCRRARFKMVPFLY